MESFANALKALAFVAVCAAVGYAAVYFTFRPSDNAGPTPGAKPTIETGSKSETSKAGNEEDRAAKDSGSGSLAAFVRKPEPAEIADISFQNEAGETIKLSDFKGRVVLLNLWATWCAPCREEMPSLNRLQEALGGNTFEVVALSLDRKGADASKAFLDEVNATALKLYIDDTARQGGALRIVGMPTTILIDAEGREVGRLSGPAEWDSDTAKELISSLLP